MKRKAAVLAAGIIALLFLSGCAKDRDQKTVVMLEKESTAPAATDASMQEVTDSPAGNWFGWWKMDQTSGDWKKAYGYHWDCMAEIRERNDGAYEVLLWDEDFTRENCLASAVISADAPYLCVSGDFLDKSLDGSSWEITLKTAENGAFLTICGNYEAVGKGGFHYTVYLRPWGCTWPGKAEDRPFSYDSWYLPLIEKGEPMPDRIGQR